MNNTDWRLVRYLDSLEHEYGYMLQTSAYVCPGWMKLIQDMLREIDEEVGGPDGDHPEFTQIKEKFGTLRVYGSNISDRVQSIINDYEALSAVTCEVCGDTGKVHVKNKWFYVRCGQHADGGLAEDED